MGFDYLSELVEGLAPHLVLLLGLVPTLGAFGLGALTPLARAVGLVGQILVVATYLVLGPETVRFVSESYVNSTAVLVASGAFWLLGFVAARVYLSGDEDWVRRVIPRIERRRTLGGLITGIVGLGLLLFHVAWQPARWVPATVALKWKHQAQFAGIYLAEDRGLFSTRGLTVDLLPGGPDPGENPFERVASGMADVAIGDPLSLIELDAAGQSFVAVAAVFRKSPAVWYGRASLGSTPDSLLGHAVAVSNGGTNTDKELLLWLARNGLGNAHQLVDLTSYLRDLNAGGGRVANRIALVPLRGTSLNSMSHFLAGNVDVWTGYASNELLNARQLLTEPLVVWRSDDDVYGDILFSSTRRIADAPEVVGALTQAIVAGWEIACNPANEQEAVNAVLKRLEDQSMPSRAHQTRMLRVLCPLAKYGGVPVGAMEDTDWESLMGDLQRFDLLPQTYGAPLPGLDAVRDGRFIESRRAPDKS